MLLAGCQDALASWSLEHSIAMGHLQAVSSLPCTLVLASAVTISGLRS